MVLNTKKTATLNLLTYTDGIQIYKSSSQKSCVWSVLCNIIELPQRIRESVNNKIISGIWAVKINLHRISYSKILFEK